MGQLGMTISNGITSDRARLPGLYLTGISSKLNAGGSVMVEEIGKRGPVWGLFDSDLLKCLDEIQRLEETGGSEAARALCNLRWHPHPGVRMAAAKALGGFPGATVSRSLQDWLLDEPNAMVQTWIVISIGRAGDCAAAADLVALLHQTDSPLLHQVIIQALGALADPSVISVIRSFANNKDRHIQACVEETLKNLRERFGD